ncbi:Cytotoxic [Burkholderia sp. GAS332]|nr:Cytotoxic [Burkholderia sp. GAS332]
MIGSLLAPTDGMSAEDRQARENLVTSLVAGIATASGTNAATAAGAAQIEGENNQWSIMAPAPRLPALGDYTGTTAKKGDGVIADPATELDPTIKAGQLVTPLPDASLIDQVFTSGKDAIKDLVDYVITSSGGNGNDARLANPGKADSPVWQDLQNAGTGVKTDGKFYYEWDYTHNDIEMCNKRGEHMGSVDPTTGEIYKPPVPGRKLNNR